MLAWNFRLVRVRPNAANRVKKPLPPVVRLNALIRATDASLESE